MHEIGRTSSAALERTLGHPHFRERLRCLKALTAEFSAELAEQFVANAHAEMRRDPRQAVECARLGSIVARAVNDAWCAVDCYRTLAEAYTLQGGFPRSLRALDQASALARRLEDASLSARLDALRLQPLIHLERYGEAREISERVLAHFESDGDRNGQIRTRMALADLAFRLERPREALRHYAKIDKLLGDAEAPRLRAAVAANRANALEACNRFRAAARHFETARDLFAAGGCDHTVAQVEYNAAYAETLRGHFEDALRRYAVTQDKFLQLEDDRHLAHIDLDRAEIHVQLNLPRDAQELAARAEKRFHGLELEKERAQAAHLGGRAAELSGDHEMAERGYRRAEKTFERLGLTERRIACLVHRACLAEQAGRLDEARHIGGEAKALLGPDANPLSAASVGLLHARLDLAEGELNRALYRADTVRMQCRRIHAPWVQIEAHRIVGCAYVLREQLDEAILAYKRAIDHLERYRGGVPPDEYMAAFLAGRSALYAEIIDLLIRAGHNELAFEFTERAKSRALVDLLAGRLQDTSLPAGTALSSRRVRHLRERLNAVYQRLFRSTAEADARSTRAVARARAQASELEGELMQLLRDERLKNREAASLAAVDAPDLEQVRRHLEPGTALLEYFVTDDQLFAFLVTGDTLHVVRQNVGTRDLRSLLERFRFHRSKFDRGQAAAEELVLRATRANLDKLAAILLGPFADRLEARRLVIIPHGLLHHLPFHALPWGDGWVADEFEVLYAPSAAVYGFCGNHEPVADQPPCVFALPDEMAPQIESEAWQVAEALDSDRVYLGEEATLERLRAEAGRCRVLHIASHGMFRREQPMLSAIRLADTWLNLYDIYSLNLGCELIVLSTCESGTADVSRGDEILGLTRGFLYAGAPALLASQWRVNDSATAEFMECFYRHLATSNDAASAHKQAMTEIRGRHPHPYYWAPFFLTGRPLTRKHPSARASAGGDTRTRVTSGQREAVY